MIAGLVVTVFRQYRAQLAVTALLLGALVALAVVDTVGMATISTEFANAGCPSAQCDAAALQVQSRFRVLGQLLPFLGLLPAAIGAFWGAPLLGREFENGTAKFAWTQSVSRRGWIVSRMLVLGASVAVGGAILGITMDHWLSVFVGYDLPVALEVESGFGHVRGAAPVAWWLFGFTLGAACGAVLRRTIPAIAVTAVVVVGALIATNLLIAVVTAGDPVSMTRQILPVEIGILLVAAVVLAAVTCRSVEHARA